MRPVGVCSGFALRPVGVCSGFALHPVGVCSGFALRPVGVRSGSALADPDRTPKANPRSGFGLLSVRLGPVGTVLASYL